MELLGYQVSPACFRNRWGEMVEYILTGKRGATYQLIRTGEILQVRNRNGNICALSGYSRFRNDRGYLEPIPFYL